LHKLEKVVQREHAMFGKFKGSCCIKGKEVKKEIVSFFKGGGGGTSRLRRNRKQKEVKLSKGEA